MVLSNNYGNTITLNIKAAHIDILVHTYVFLWLLSVEA